jgi:hypothetical protein
MRDCWAKETVNEKAIKRVKKTKDANFFILPPSGVN